MKCKKKSGEKKTKIKRAEERRGKNLDTKQQKYHLTASNEIVPQFFFVERKRKKKPHIISCFPPSTSPLVFPFDFFFFFGSLFLIFFFFLKLTCIHVGTYVKRAKIIKKRAK